MTSFLGLGPGRLLWSVDWRGRPRCAKPSSGSRCAAGCTASASSAALSARAGCVASAMTGSGSSGSRTPFRRCRLGSGQNGYSSRGCGSRRWIGGRGRSGTTRGSRPPSGLEAVHRRRRIRRYTGPGEFLTARQGGSNLPWPFFLFHVTGVAHAHDLRARGGGVRDTRFLDGEDWA